MTGPGDSNVGFVLEAPQKARIKELMDGLLEGLPQGYSVLIDRAGRIVETAKEPAGVTLEALSALSAGCYATTLELAKVMGEEDYSLLFRQEDDHQVYIWPVANRALLVALLATAKSVEMLEENLGGAMGRELIGLVREAKMPERTVPPPRIVPSEVPFEVRSRMHALTALIMDLQAKKPEAFTEEVKKVLLRVREELIRTIAASDWRRAIGICEWGRRWLADTLKLPRDAEPGKVLTSLYREVFAHVHAAMAGSVPAERLGVLYRKTYSITSRRWPRVCVSDSCATDAGINVEVMWDRAQASSSDTGHLAREFVQAVDEIVRELLRVVYLSRGQEGRKEVVAGAEAILARHRDALLLLGLGGLAGAGWSLLNFSEPPKAE